MKSVRARIAIAGMVLCVVSSAEGSVGPVIIAQSRFDVAPVPPDDGLEGWTIVDPLDIYVFWQQKNGTPTDPDGYIRFIDPDPHNLGVISAPTAFLGNWSSLDGLGQLCYEMKVFQSDTTVGINPYSVTIMGGPEGNITATWTGDTPPGPTPWIPVNVPIAESQGWVVSGGNWDALLTNVTSLHVQMELFNNSAISDERTGVDNIVLSTIPEPSTLVLLTMGTLTLTVGWWRRRRVT